LIESTAEKEKAIVDFGRAVTADHKAAGCYADRGDVYISEEDYKAF